MSKVESTPEMASKMYAAMEARLAIVRKRLNQPLTLADKILFGHLDDPQNQPLEPGKATLFLRPDRVVLQDVLGQSAFLQFMDRATLSGDRFEILHWTAGPMGPSRLRVRGLLE